LIDIVNVWSIYYLGSLNRWIAFYIKKNIYIDIYVKNHIIILFYFIFSFPIIVRVRFYWKSVNPLGSLGIPDTTDVHKNRTVYRHRLNVFLETANDIRARALIRRYISKHSRFPNPSCGTPHGPLHTHTHTHTHTPQRCSGTKVYYIYFIWMSKLIHHKNT